MRTMQKATSERGQEIDEARERADVELARAGSLAAFERLYRSNVARILTLARRLLGEGTAEEETQEVFVRAWRRLDSFRAEARFSTWLYRLATNHFLSHLRAAGEDRLASEELAGDLLAMPVAPHERRLDLESALRRLPAAARHVVVLHDCLGHTHAEIAAQLGITTGTSKSQLHRGRLLLRSWIDPEGGGAS